MVTKLPSCPDWCRADHAGEIAQWEREGASGGVWHWGTPSPIPTLSPKADVAEFLDVQLSTWQDGPQDAPTFYVTILEFQLDLTAAGARALATALLEHAERIEAIR